MLLFWKVMDGIPVGIELENETNFVAKVVDNKLVLLNAEEIINISMC
jgi:hypothetical protein